MILLLLCAVCEPAANQWFSARPIARAPVSLHLLDIIILCAGVWWCSALLRQHQTHARKLPSQLLRSVDVAVMIYVIASLCLLLPSLSSGGVKAVKCWLFTVGPTLLLPVTARLVTQELREFGLRSIDKWICMAAGISLLSGIVWYYIGIGKADAEIGMEYNLAGNRFTNAFYQSSPLYSILLILWTMSRSKMDYRPLMYIWRIVLGLLGLTASFCRAGWLAGLVMLPTSYLVFPAAKYVRGMFTLLSLMSVLWIGRGTLPKQFSMAIDSEVDRKISRVFRGESEGSYDMRAAMYREALNKCLQNPIAGIGYQGLRLTAPDGSQRAVITHNGYLQVAVAGGLLLLVPLLAVVIIVCSAPLTPSAYRCSESMAAVWAWGAGLIWLSLWPQSISVWILGGFAVALLTPKASPACGRIDPGRRISRHEWRSIRTIAAPIPLGSAITQGEISFGSPRVNCRNLQKQSLTILLLLLILGSHGQTRATDATLFVSTTGRDGWSGLLAEPNHRKTDGPFATMGRAREWLQLNRASVNGSGGVVVCIRGGTYHVSQTIEFGSAESGSAGSHLVVQSYPGESVVITGGLAVSAWTHFRGEVVQAALPARLFGRSIPSQLFYRGQRLPIARTPNLAHEAPETNSWSYVAGILRRTHIEYPDDSRSRFRVRQQDLPRWKEPSGAQVVIYPRYNYWNEVLGIADYDAQSGELVLAKPAKFAIRPGDRYYLQNVLEELDSAGEWFWDSTRGTLYLWPPGPLDPLSVSLPIVNSLISINHGAHDISILGLTFESTAGTAIRIGPSATNCNLSYCSLRLTGSFDNSAVSITGGISNAVIGCLIQHTGSHGISILTDEAHPQQSQNNCAMDNWIANVGELDKKGAGIRLYGSGNRAVNNHIHNCPRFGIEFAGLDNIVEYNHIHDVNLETDGCGGIYTYGRDWINSRGSVVQYNYIHDSIGYGFADGHRSSPKSSCGVYLDDNTAGVNVVSNVIARCSLSGIFLHNAMDCTVSRNAILDCTGSQIKATGWLATDAVWRSALPALITGYDALKRLPAGPRRQGIARAPLSATQLGGLTMAGNLIESNTMFYDRGRSVPYEFYKFPGTSNCIVSNVSWYHTELQLSAMIAVALNASDSFLKYPQPFSANERWKSVGFPQCKMDCRLAFSRIADPRETTVAYSPDHSDTVDLVSTSSPVLRIFSDSFPSHRSSAYRIRAVLRSSLPGAFVEFGIFGWPSYDDGVICSVPVRVSNDWCPVEVTLPSLNGSGTPLIPGVNFIRFGITIRNDSGAVMMHSIRVDQEPA